MRHGRWYPTGVGWPTGASRSSPDSTKAAPGSTAQPRHRAVHTLARPERARHRRPAGHASAAAGEPPIGGPLPAHVRDAVGTHHGGGAVSRGHLVPQPARRRRTRTPGRTIPNMPRTGSGAPRCWCPAARAARRRVMQLGGSTPARSDRPLAAYDRDLRRGKPGGWAGSRSGRPMQVGRGHHNTVLLPDGSMVTVGGGVGIRDGDQWDADPEQRQVELWDPATGAWTLGPSQAETRAYHSTALLLPDGRVVSAGDDVNGGTDRRHRRDLRTPLPLQGPAPHDQLSASHRARRRQLRRLHPDTNITGATLVAPGATTHANDMNQRYIPLTVAQRAGGVTLTAPANADTRHPRLLHALPAQQPRRPIRRQVHAARIRMGAAPAAHPASAVRAVGSGAARPTAPARSCTFTEDRVQPQALDALGQRVGLERGAARGLRTGPQAGTALPLLVTAHGVPSASRAVAPAAVSSSGRAWRSRGLPDAGVRSCAAHCPPAATCSP